MEEVVRTPISEPVGVVVQVVLLTGVIVEESDNIGVDVTEHCGLDMVFAISEKEIGEASFN